MTPWLRQASLITVVFQNTALALCMRYSRIPKEDGSKELYLVSTAVFSGEVMKLLVSTVLASWSYSPLELIKLFFSRDALVMLIPAALYSFQNGLQYVAASNLDVSVCQVLYQMKLVTTALFSVTMLGRQLSRNQWLGIAACAAGVAVVQLSTVETQSRTDQSRQAWMGFLAVTTACMTSGLAAAYTEKIFKTGNTSLWVRNMHLAAWSLMAVGSSMALTDGAKITALGYALGSKRFLLPMGWHCLHRSGPAGSRRYGGGSCGEICRQHLERFCHSCFHHPDLLRIGLRLQHAAFHGFLAGHKFGPHVIVLIHFESTCPSWLPGGSHQGGCGGEWNLHEGHSARQELSLIVLTANES